MHRLRIVQINDVYALDHLPRLASLIRHHREHDPADRLLVVLCGDFLAPSLLSGLDAGRGAVDCLNQLPLTHVILGNHEDDVPLAELRARLRELRATVLVTNVHGLDDDLPRTDVIELGPVRIGVVGVVSGESTLYRRAPFGGARVDPANSTARAVADRLLAEGCAAVIPLTHQRVDEDRALAATRPAFPIVLGGHEHGGLVERVGATWLTKAPADAVAVVVAELGVDDRGAIVVTARLEPVAAFPEDPGMRERVDGHLRRVHELEAATVLLLRPGERLSSVGTRSRQTSMGTLLCSCLRDVFRAEGALLNGGGIRGDRDYEGRLTFGDVEREVPFDAEVSLARLPGEVLRDAIAASRSRAPAESGAFLQVDDRMRVDPVHGLTHVAGAPLDLARPYTVALPRPLFDGMDHIAPLVGFAVAHPDELPPVGCGRPPKVALLDAFAAILWDALGGFDGLDRDRDGVVTPAEILHALAAADPRPTSPVAGERLVEAHDRDASGTITRDERS